MPFFKESKSQGFDGMDAGKIEFFPFAFLGFIRSFQGNKKRIDSPIADNATLTFLCASGN